jgi:hypothetical protein
MPILTIHEHNADYHQIWTGPDGQVRAKGLIPRDYQKNPLGSYEAIKPFPLQLIPENEWQGRLDAIHAAKASLIDIRNRGMNGQPIPSRDQNGKGYCWMHSGTSAAMIIRAIMGAPYADLSAYAGACMIKNYRDEGGNGIDGVQFIGERGIPTSQFWPQQSMSRANDNPQTWANAAQNKYQDWSELDPAQAKAQLVTSILNGIPVVSDFNWWSHSVCTVDIVSFSPFTTTIWNSWGDSWSQNGMGNLVGNHAVPDGAVLPLVMTPAPA